MYDFEVWYNGMVIGDFKANNQEHADKLVKQLYSGNVSAKPTLRTKQLLSLSKENFNVKGS